jgi:hypothetical protein
VKLDSAALVGLTEAAGIDLADLQLGDGKKAFQRSPIVGTTQLAAIPWSVLRAVLDAYGDSVQLAIDYEDIPIHVLDASMDEASWRQICLALEPSGQYRIRIGIDKARLLELNGFTGPNICHFFFASQLLVLLDEGASRIEAEIWDVADCPALIMVGDVAVDLAGPLLRVTGGTCLDDAAVPVAQIAADVVAALRDARRENASVDAAAIGDLTPWHVRATPEMACSGMGEEIRVRLAALHAQLCLLSLCDRARNSGSATAARVEFRSTERLVSVTLDTVSACLRAVTDAQGSALMSVVSWCYEDVLHPAARSWTAQRIQFVQVRIALLAGSAPDAGEPAAVLRAITDIDTVKDVFWKAFLEDAVSDYLDRLRELDEEIDKTADAYGEQASGITDTLTNSVLAAVGVFIGSIIAAAFIKPFNADLFRVGVWAYTVYIAVFPAGLGLSVQASHYRDLHTRFGRRQSDYESLLGADHVRERIGRRITDARRSWKRFFATAVVLYVIVVAVALVGGVEVPQIVKAPTTVTVTHPESKTATNKHVRQRASETRSSHP